MFAIGEFARHGRVSVRTLHHYDAVGLLEPACVDPATGYRFYDAGQLSRLNRIVALKNLGFTLQQVASILAEEVGAAELRGMLMLRRAELREQLAVDAARLAQVEARLLAIESESGEPSPVVVKRIAPVRVAELTGMAAGYEPQFITPVIRLLYHDLPKRDPRCRHADPSRLHGPRASQHPGTGQVDRRQRVPVSWLCPRAHAPVWRSRR